MATRPKVVPLPDGITRREALQSRAPACATAGCVAKSVSRRLPDGGWTAAPLTMGPAVLSGGVKPAVAPISAALPGNPPGANLIERARPPLRCIAAKDSERLLPGGSSPPRSMLLGPTKNPGSAGSCSSPTRPPLLLNPRRGGDTLATPLLGCGPSSKAEVQGELWNVEKYLARRQGLGEDLVEGNYGNDMVLKSKAKESPEVASASPSPGTAPPSALGASGSGFPGAIAPLLATLETEKGLACFSEGSPALAGARALQEAASSTGVLGIEGELDAGGPEPASQLILKGTLAASAPGVPPAEAWVAGRGGGAPQSQIAKGSILLAPGAHGEKSPSRLLAGQQPGTAGPKVEPGSSEISLASPPGLQLPTAPKVVPKDPEDAARRRPLREGDRVGFTDRAPNGAGKLWPSEGVVREAFVGLDAYWVADQATRQLIRKNGVVHGFRREELRALDSLPLGGAPGPLPADARPGSAAGTEELSENPCPRSLAEEAKVAEGYAAVALPATKVPGGGANSPVTTATTVQEPGAAFKALAATAAEHPAPQAQASVVGEGSQGSPTLTPGGPLEAPVTEEALSSSLWAAGDPLSGAFSELQRAKGDGRARALWAPWATPSSLAQQPLSRCKEEAAASLAVARRRAASWVQGKDLSAEAAGSRSALQERLHEAEDGEAARQVAELEEEVQMRLVQAETAKVAVDRQIQSLEEQLEAFWPRAEIQDGSPLKARQQRETEAASAVAPSLKQEVGAGAPP